jgi:hypothetical protein
MDEDADAARFDPKDPDANPLSNMPPPAKDVSIGHAFSVGLVDGVSLTLGQKTRALVAFANSGRVAYHVWGVMGSLNMPNEFSSHVQNFSYSGVNHTVPSGGELSFDYTFEPNERLDTRDFILALSVFYEAQGASGNVIRAHSSTFFNQTIATVAGPQDVSNFAFMAVLLLVVGAISAGVFFSGVLAPEAKRSTIDLGAATATTSDGEEWLEEHKNMMQGGGRAKSSKPSKGKAGK